MDAHKSSSRQSSEDTDSSSFWLMIGTLYFNTFFFKKGIILLSSDIPNETFCPTNKSFTINSRIFSLYDPTQIASKKPHESSLSNTRNLLSILLKYSSKEKTKLIEHHTTQSVLFNETRREELFLPIEFENTSMYLYPWCAKSIKKFEFNGFKQFVTAGCMFGASLQGITNYGRCVELINHGLSLAPPEHITCIKYDPNTINPYEETLFYEFEKNCFLVKTLSLQGEPPKMTYHVPIEDYILFGIKLALQNQMSRAALEHFIQIIINHQASYQEKIIGIAEHYGIALSFSSPLCTLFEKEDGKYTVSAILSQLDYQKYESEHEFVTFCISKLIKEEELHPLSSIWNDFLSCESDAPKTIEELFKIANAVLSASVSSGLHDYEACSLLPLSEKQIQIQYEQYRKKMTSLDHDPSKKYPAHFNLTTFDPIITYSPTTQGLLFYFAHSLALLAHLISEHNLVRRSSLRLRLFQPATEVNEDLLMIQEENAKNSSDYF